MGSVTSTEEYVQEEFKRLNKEDERDFLVLDQLFDFRQKYIEHPVDPTHLGVLFLLDKNKNGKFTIEGFYDFVKLYEQQSAITDAVDFQSQFQAFCTLKMWNKVSQPGGTDIFVDCNSQYQYFDNHPGVIFVSRDTVKGMHKILNINESYGYDFQTFFDLLQRVAEDQALMYLKEEELDELVPLIVLKQFAHAFIKGFVHLMTELGFEPDIKLE